MKRTVYIAANDMKFLKEIDRLHRLFCQKKRLIPFRHLGAMA